MTTSDLKTIFEKQYNHSDWTNALRDIFHVQNLWNVPKVVELYENTYGATAYELGFFETSEGLLVGLYEVNITPELRLERNKVGLRNLMRKVYTNDADAALIVFSQGTTWRFTYASELTLENKETGKRERRQTDPKRYTYILGEHRFCRTAVERFGSIKPVNLLTPKISIKEIEKAFSVETLTKDFYKDLFVWYQWALSDDDGFEVTYPNDTSTEADDRKIDEHLIRLITRLMFVWFIKQKNLIPEQIFQTSELNNILKDFDPISKISGNYYNAILQNLFFATLNKAINEREFAKVGSFQEQREHYGIKTLYRNTETGSWFKITNNEVLQLFKKVPFLNGGLFECLDKENETGKIFYYDGFSRRAGRQKRAFLPNCLFFDPEKGLIPILEKYNFTVEENTPNDIEIALDPELLGNVFENLLGAYNPETKETARKQSGSFYTPREIVNYMVDESLIAYLKTACPDIPVETIHQLFNSETLPVDLQSTPEVTERLALKLKEAKILDPACGSGAFPMGILNRMLDLLKKLHTEDRHSIYDLKLQLIEKCIYGIDIQTIAVQISKLRFFISLICEQVPTDNSDENYGITSLPNLETKFVAANTLIGLKVDFSDKLDFQDDNLVELKTKLWNIRHKHFLAGNAHEKHALRKEDEKLRGQIKQYLIDRSSISDSGKIERCQNQVEKLKIERVKFEKEKWEDTTEQAKLQTQLDFGFEPPVIQQQSLFQVDVNSQKRAEIDNQLRRVEIEITKELSKTKNIGFEDEAEKLAHWDPYNQNKSSDFFDGEWMFGLSKGRNHLNQSNEGFFDVILGNPPYLRIQGIRDTNPKLADELCINYKSATGSFDLYVVFTEKALNLAKSESGIVNFIMPVKWTNAAFGKGLRSLISRSFSASKIINFGAYQVFNASTYTGLQWFKCDSKELSYTELDRNLETKQDLSNYLTSLNDQKFSKIANSKLNSDNWVLTVGGTSHILTKLNKHSRKVKDVFDKIFQGLATSKDDVYFIYNGANNENIVSGYSKYLQRNVEIERSLLKPLLKGEDVHRYETISTSKFVIYPYKIEKEKAVLYTETEIENCYPLGYLYLKECESVLRGREKGRLLNDDFWFRYIYPKNLVLFANEKLVAPDISLGGNFCYDELGLFYSTTTIYGYIKKEGINESYKFLMALLNSKLFWWFLVNTGTTLANDYFRFKPDYINPFPIPGVIDLNTTLKVEKIVDQILEIKKNQKKVDTFLLERQIDELVYKLYNLTYEEVKVVDPGFWLSSEEYGNVRLGLPEDEKQQ